MAGSGQVAVEVVGIAHPADGPVDGTAPVVSPAPGIVSSVIGLDRP
jgi:hypothetical protein